MATLDITFVLRARTPCLYVQDEHKKIMFAADGGGLIYAEPDGADAHHVTLTQEDLFRAYRQILKEKGVL